ncbi:MAG: hypothetical protein ACXACI_12150 [Candidatus Hodarchaeales archaeon]|jgi:hypothetical protein
MRASLPPLKKTRLPWFDEAAQVEIEREVAIEYSLTMVQQDSLVHHPRRRYLFLLPEEREVPQSDVILMTQGLPFITTSTPGNISEKLPTVWLADPTIVTEDRIVNRIKGKETVTVEDTPYPDKIQETRVREDLLTRKILLKNELGKDLQLIVKIIESADVQMVETTPEPTKVDKPINEYEITLAKDAEESIQCKYQIRIEKTRTIDKPKPEKKSGRNQ